MYVFTILTPGHFSLFWERGGREKHWMVASLKCPDRARDRTRPDQVPYTPGPGLGMGNQTYNLSVMGQYSNWAMLARAKAILFLQDNVHYYLHKLLTFYLNLLRGYSLCDQHWVWILALASHKTLFSPPFLKVWIASPTIPYCSLSCPSKFTHSISHSTRGLCLIEKRTPLTLPKRLTSWQKTAK